MKSENREFARNAVDHTRKDLRFRESTTSKFVLTAELVRLLKPLVFPPRNRKKLSASFTATAPNNPTQAATLLHVRRFSFLRKVSPFGNRRHTRATVRLVFEGINVPKICENRSPVFGTFISPKAVDLCLK